MHKYTTSLFYQKMHINAHTIILNNHESFFIFLQKETAPDKISDAVSILIIFSLKTDFQWKYEIASTRLSALALVPSAFSAISSTDAAIPVMEALTSSLDAAFSSEIALSD